MSATPLEIADALADALVQVSPEQNIQVHGRMMFSPTPPAIDIYPANPSEGPLGFGPESGVHYFTIRMRVATSDEDGQQEVLLRSRERTGPNSVREALLSDVTLGGLVDGLEDPGPPTGYQLYLDGTERLLGHEWTVGVQVGPDS